VNNCRPAIWSAVVLALLATACARQTPQDKAAADARAVAHVEAVQKVKPPVQPLEVGAVNPTVRRLFNLSESGCAFFTDPNPGAFPLAVIGRSKAVLLLNGEPAIFAADSGSPELAAGIHEKYVGRMHSAQIAQAPDRVTIRDQFERIVYQGAGRLSCRS
jgi:hypothetical protein